MAQPSLFAASETLLVDDERGRIAYAPGFIASETAKAWFVEIRESVQWRAQRRMMFDREVDVPRLVAHFRLDPPSELVPRAILDATRRVTEYLREPFNSVGLNLYRDGRDSVAPHNDHLNEIRKGRSIALISIGATRRMSIRAREPRRRGMHLDLEPGSLLVMSYATQLHYTHGVPKTPAVVGERISLAFRVKLAPSTVPDSCATPEASMPPGRESCCLSIGGNMDHPKPGFKYVEAKDLEDRAKKFAGVEVRGSDGSKLGEVEGFVMDMLQGRPRHVAVSAGWFIHKHFLLPIGKVALSRDGNALVADIAKERVERFPGFDKSEFDQLGSDDLVRLDAALAAEWPAVGGTAAATHFDVPEWWQNERGSA